MSARVKKTLIYAVVPVAIALPLILAYFSGVGWLQQVVSPRITGMWPKSSREFGLLENLQNVMLLAIAVIATMAVKRKERRLEKVGFAAIFVFAVFVFLEEIDYGLHFYEYAKGVRFDEVAQVRNLHNLGDTNKLVKRLLDTGMVAMFVIAPLVFAKSRKPLLRYVTPDRYSILTLLAMLAMSQLAHFLRNAEVGTPGNIDKNISEFRELSIYYLFLVFLYTVVFQRNWETAPAEPEDASE